MCVVLHVVFVCCCILSLYVVIACCCCVLLYFIVAFCCIILYFLSQLTISGTHTRGIKVIAGVWGGGEVGREEGRGVDERGSDLVRDGGRAVVGGDRLMPPGHACPPRRPSTRPPVARCRVVGGGGRLAGGVGREAEVRGVESSVQKTNTLRHQTQIFEGGGGQGGYGGGREGGGGDDE